MTTFSFDVDAALKRAKDLPTVPNRPNRPNREDRTGARLGGLGGLGWVSGSDPEIDTNTLANEILREMRAAQTPKAMRQVMTTRAADVAFIKAHNPVRCIHMENLIEREAKYMDD